MATKYAGILRIYSGTPTHVPPGRLHPGVLTMPPMQPIDEYDERLVLVLALT